MKALIIFFIMLVSACSQASPAIPTITPSSPLISLQQDIHKASESLSNEYQFNMALLSDPTQTDNLLSIVSLICKNLEQETPRQDIESALLADYGVVGSRDLIKLSIKHRCPQFS